MGRTAVPDAGELPRTRFVDGDAARSRLRTNQHIFVDRAHRVVERGGPEAMARLLRDLDARIADFNESAERNAKAVAHWQGIIDRYGPDMGTETAARGSAEATPPSTLRNYQGCGGCAMRSAPG